MHAWVHEGLQGMQGMQGMRTLSVETGEHPSSPLCCQPVCGICPQVQSEGLTGPRINVTTRRTRLISPHRRFFAVYHPLAAPA